MESNDDKLVLSEDEALHRALCALALGELEGEEARTLEARVAAEPALGAQLEEVRATIALVRSSLAGPEALPPPHLERVLSGARAAAGAGGSVIALPWHRRPAVRLAASLVLCAGAGFVGLRTVLRAPAAAPYEDATDLARREVSSGSGLAADARGAAPVREANVPASRDQPLAKFTGVTPKSEAELSAPADAREQGLAFGGEPAARQAELEQKAGVLRDAVDGVRAGDGMLVGAARAGLGNNGQGDKGVGTLFSAIPQAQDEGTAPPPVEVAYPLDRGAGAVNPGAVNPDGGSGAPHPDLAAAKSVLEFGKAADASRADAPLAGGRGGQAGRGPGQRGWPGAGGPRAPLGASGPSSPGLAVTAPAPGATAVPAERGRGPRPAALGFDLTAELPPATGGGEAGGGRAAPVDPAHPADHLRAPATPPVSGEEPRGDDFSLRLREYRDDASGNPRLSEEQLGRLVEDEWRRLHASCQRYPHERPRDMFFRFWGDNAFVRTAEDALSTFGADVDTASYALARRYLREGRAPERAQIRTEEFVNAFTPDLAAPTEETFGLHMELAPTPFGEDASHWLMRVGVRGKEVAKAERQPLHLTFVVDTSGSMREQNRLELVKHAMRLLVTQLDARDTIAIVAYSNEPRQVLAPTSAAHRELIESAIHPLSPSGSTNAEAGLRMGYALAETTVTPGTHSRVVFLSDGVANVGQTDQDRINADVKRFRDAGIYLNAIGVGMNNHNDAFLEQLANKGDGICDYIDDAAAAQKAIVERFTGAFVPIASDVKLQVEFDPAQVVRWRQLGYENRAIADQDFRNDAIDAGEVGAGHQVTCLYEIELAGGVAQVDSAKALATLRVRWKAPKGARQDPREVDVFEREATLGYGGAAASFRAASLGFRRSALAAQLAEFLRRSTHARADDYAELVAEVGALIDASPSSGAGRSADELAELADLADLVRRADGLGFGQRLPETALERMIDEYRRYQYLRATLQELESEGDPMLRQLEEMNGALERQIRDLLKRDLQERRG